MGEVEVDESEPAIRVEHHVGRLQVAVDVSAVVEGRDGVRQGHSDLDHPLMRETASADRERPDVLLQRLPAEIFDDEGQFFAVVTDVVQLRQHAERGQIREEVLLAMQAWSGVVRALRAAPVGPGTLEDARPGQENVDRQLDQDARGLAQRHDRPVAVGDPGSETRRGSEATCRERIHDPGGQLRGRTATVRFQPAAGRRQRRGDLTKARLHEQIAEGAVAVVDNATGGHGSVGGDLGSAELASGSCKRRGDFDGA